ncbi:hypothetical protein Tco_0687025 [Tanacetum coccineum]
MVPRTVLTRSGPISVNTARPVNTVQPRTIVNNAGPIKNVINNTYSTARRPFNKITTTNNSNFTKKVNTVKGTRINTARPKAVISAVKGNKGNVVKASACWGNPQQDLKDKGVIDSGCSRHMTGNRSYLTDYEEVNGGFVAFGGNSKGGKITGKGRKPALNFMRPFGCPVTILNTIDHLGKFNRKDTLPIAKHSECSTVEENMHVQFSENKPNNAGSGPNWLFDIDALTNSMNYKPVFAGNQSNGNAGTKACDDAGEEEKKNAEDLGNESGNPTEGKDRDVPSTEEPRINQVLDVVHLLMLFAQRLMFVDPKTTLLPMIKLCLELKKIVYSVTFLKVQEITKLKKRVKKLEGKGKSKPLGMKRLFKIGRSALKFFSKIKVLGAQEDDPNRNDEEMFDTGILDGEEVFAEQDVVEKLDENVAREMKKHMEIVPDDEVAIDAIPLATKPPIIVDRKIIKEGKMGYFQIIRAYGSSKRPEEGYKRVLWGDLKVMFKPHVESEV